MTVTLPAGDFDTHAGSDPHPSLYNEDLAPLPEEKRRWGAFEFFNVWTNDVQSLAGYTLAASLFITAGINGWWVFAAIILAGFFVNFLVNLTGKPSVKYGIPYAVMARSSMGVRGAQFPGTHPRDRGDLLVRRADLLRLDRRRSRHQRDHRHAP